MIKVHHTNCTKAWLNTSLQGEFTGGFQTQVPITGRIQLSPNSSASHHPFRRLRETVQRHQFELSSVRGGTANKEPRWAAAHRILSRKRFDPQWPVSQARQYSGKGDHVIFTNHARASITYWAGCISHQNGVTKTKTPGSTWQYPPSSEL